MPHYDTGAWSLYDQYGESNLNYHELLTEFLQHLCERTRKGPPLTPAAPPAAPDARARHHDAAPRRRHRRRERGAAASARAAPRRDRRSRAIEIYCTTAQRFTDRPAARRRRSRC